MKRFLLIFLLSGLMLRADWVVSDPGNWNSSPAQSLQLNSLSGGSSMMAMSASSAAGADDITPEIQAIAEGLGRDPVKIYEWVKNTIDFVPYNGLKRGAHLTAMEKAGNDFDTAALLVSLLRASGYTDVSYRFGKIEMPMERSDQNDVVHWLGVHKTQAYQIVWRAGMSYPWHTPSVSSGYATLTAPRIWVVLVDDENEYVLDPSFKRYRLNTPVSLSSATDYNKSQLLTSVGGTLSGSSYTMTTTGRDNLKTLLNGYNNQLVSYARETLPDKSGLSLSGAKEIQREIIDELPTQLPDGFSLVGAVLTWTSIPQDYAVVFSINVGDISFSRNTAEMNGRKLAVWFNAGRAELWLEDEKVDQETSYNSQIPAAISFGYTYENGNFTMIKDCTPLQRTGAYVVQYGYDQSLGRLQNRLKKQSEYVADGIPVSDRRMITENLNIIGLQYLNQTSLANSVLGGVTDAYVSLIQFAGIIGQNNGSYVDFPIATVNMWTKANISAPDAETALRKLFLSHSYVLSAFEHIALEQITAGSSVSTSKLLQRAADLNNPVFLVKNQTEYDAIKSQLTNYIGTGHQAAIESIITSGGWAFMPKNHAMTYDDYNGTGYQLVVNGGLGARMQISGGYAGGFTATQGAVPDPGNIKFESHIAEENIKLGGVTIDEVALSDPVDAATGAFYIRASDLAIGEGTTSGLKLDLHYSTNRIRADDTGLGRGWTHNYNMQLATRSPSDIDLIRATAAEIAPYIVAAKVAYDIFKTDGNAKEWLIPTVTSCWLGEQLVKTRTSVLMGENTLEFTKLPDGTFAPPAGVNATLTKQANGSHLLKFRKGHEIYFRSTDGKFTSITDRNNSASVARTLTADYNSDGTLNRVTDSFDRYFQFNYSGGKLTEVADSTGRSVFYGTETVGTTPAFKVIDPEGKKTLYLHDSKYRITEIKDPLGRTTITTSYDQWDRALAQRTFGEDPRLWRFNYAPGLTRYRDPGNRESWYYFDFRGRSIAKINELGQKTSTVYDGVDRTIETFTALNEKTVLTYDKNHELLTVTNPALHTRTITPESENSTTTPRTENNFEGQSTVTTYYSYHLPQSVTLPGGIKTEFEYDTRGRLSRMHPAAFAADEWIVYTYDSSPGYTQRSKATYPDGTTEILNFNARGDLTQRIDRRGKKSTFAYNLRRQVTQAVLWTGSYTDASPLGGTPPAGSLSTTTGYDDAGNISHVIDSLGRRTDYEYDALGNLLTVYGPDGTILTDNYYDNLNLLATTFDALGNQTDYNYDAASRLKEVLDPLGRSLKFGYDANGRRTTVTSALNNVTTDHYTATGFKDTMTDALGQVIHYDYDKDGRLKTLTNRRSYDYTTAYNDASRLITSKTPLLKTTIEERNTRGLVSKATQPSTSTLENTVFDTEGRVLTQVVKAPGGAVVSTTTFTYHPGGLLWTVTETPAVGTAITTTRTYDDFGRLYSYDDGEGHTLGYRYDGAGNLWKLIYPDGKTVTYGYDDYNRLETVTDWATRVTTYTYDVGGRLVRTDRPNGTWRKHVYDAAGQVRQIEERDAGGTVLWLQALKYDLEGRITWTYTYPTPAAFTLPGDTATHDADNRVSLWTPPSAAAITPVFDDNGNMTSGPGPLGTTLSYTYDTRNRLTAADGQSYRYNPEGHRVQVNTTTYVVDPAASLSRVLVRDQGGTLTYYVWGLGLLYEDTTGATKTYHPNHQGSTVALTDGSGTVTDRVEYAPYGGVTSRMGLSDTPFLLHGAMGVMTESSGMIYMRARYYNPRLMRFLNADPIGFGGGLNWYAYANGNPVMFSDPSGLDALLSDLVRNGTFPAARNDATVVGSATYNAGTPYANQVGQEYAGYAASFGKGVAVGAGSAVVIAGAAAGAVTVGVPAGVVTGGLYLLGLGGAVSTGVSIYNDPSANNIAYNAGALAGAGLASAAVAGPLGQKLSPPGYTQSVQAPKLADEVNMLWRGENGEIPVWAYLKNFNTANATGPTFGGNIGAVGITAAGAAALFPRK